MQSRLLKFCTSIILLAIISVYIYILLLHLCNYLITFISLSPTTSEHVPVQQSLHRVFPSNELYNMTNFTWEKNNPTMCSIQSEDLPESKLLLLMIHTARDNFENRKIIRETYGSKNVPLEGWILKLVFLVGSSNPKRNMTAEEFQMENNSLAQEHQYFGDLVQGNFIDGYLHLSYKTLMGYKWVLEFCQNADFIFKVDDDIFLDLPKLLRLRMAELNSAKPLPNMYCFTGHRKAPFRDPLSKYYLSLQDYPKPFLPDFCYGPFYGISVDLVYKIYSVHQKGAFVFLEDVFVTGVLLEIAKKEYNDTLVVTKRDISSDYELCHLGNCYQKYCNEKKYTAVRNFSFFAKILRDKKFKMNMECLWKITQIENELLYVVH